MITQIKTKITQIIGQITQIKQMPRDTVGVDIAEGRITVVDLSASPQTVIKNIVIRDIATYKTDDEISNAVNEIFHEKGLSKKEVWLNLDLPSRLLNFGRTSLPVMPGAEIADAVKWNLKDKVALDIKDVQLGYEVVGESTQDGGSKSLNIMAALAQKGLIDRFVNIFKKAGITLAGISVTPFSISNLLRLDSQMAQKKEPLLVCHIGVEYSYICFYVAAKLDFVRQIPLAWATFLNSMTGVLVSDTGKVELTIQDAKRILEETGIPKESDAISGGKVTPAQLMALIRPVIERFAGEFLRSIEYYQREFNSQKIENILLTGEGSQIKGLTEFISKSLNLNVEYLKLPKELICGAALGVAFGNMGKINLLPEEIKQKKQEEMEKTAVRVASIGILALLFFSFLTISAHIANYRKELGLIQKQRLILKDLKVMQDKITAVQAIVSSVRNDEIPVDLVLKGLSIITPANVMFAEVSLNQKEKRLKLVGKASVKPEAVQGVLSNFMQALEKSTFFKEANLVNVQRDASAAGEISTFELNCRMH